MIYWIDPDCNMPDIAVVQGKIDVDNIPVAFFKFVYIHFVYMKTKMSTEKGKISFIAFTRHKKSLVVMAKSSIV